MFKVFLHEIKLRLFAGILKEEHSKKNTILLNIEYHEEKKNIVDYSSVYDKAVKTALSKRWLLLEDLAESVGREIRKSHKHIKYIRVSAQKISPSKMKNCSSAEVVYETK